MFEFLIPRRPVSAQTRRKERLREWKVYVNSVAAQCWSNATIKEGDIRLSLVYICDDSPADIDNIIKPIQDSLIGLVYEDDILVSDVDSHRRYLSDPIEINGLPDMLSQAIETGAEAVYVRVTEADKLQVYL